MFTRLIFYIAENSPSNLKRHVKSEENLLDSIPEGFSQINNPSMALLGSQPSPMHPVQTNTMKSGGGMEVKI